MDLKKSLNHLNWFYSGYYSACDACGGGGDDGYEKHYGHDGEMSLCGYCGGEKKNLSG